MLFFFIFLGSFALTYLLIPKIISVVVFKRLMDHPNDRSSHKTEVPSLGGIAFFTVLIFGLYFLQPFDYESKAICIVPGLLILFLAGLKDDLVVLSPFAKIGAQLVAIAFLLSHHDFHVTNLHGFMGIHSISLFVTLPLSAFVMLAIINAFNLIDGIDGLAGVVGIIIFSVLS
ncbi:MAG: hypothetical protein RLZ10_1292, partial [Bacteroidota bacterium]